MGKIAFLVVLASFVYMAFAYAEQPAVIKNGHHPEAFIDSIQNDPHAGQKVYEQFCSTCHAKDPSIEIGAPHFRVVKDWEKRVNKGLPGLLR